MSGKSWNNLFDKIFPDTAILIARLIFAAQLKARVAKLVDALSSGGSIRKVVLVRIQSRAQSPFRLHRKGHFYLEALEACFQKRTNKNAYRRRRR